MQKYIIKITIAGLLIFLAQIVKAQAGLNFQGVARTSNNVILASQPISLRLSILQGTANGNVEYSETRKVTTNAQGLFAVVIGDADATNIFGAFNTINWKNTPKFLKIEMDPTAGNNFTTMGATQFQYVAYAQFANSVDAGNINGIIPIDKGGTGVASITSLKTALTLDKVNNTTDAEKPISTKTQAALDLILATANDTSRFSNRINAKANITDVSTALLSKVDKVTGKDLSSNDYTNADKSKLAAITGVNTGDQDLSSLATISALALKANTADVNAVLGLKANTTDVSTALLSKVDKVIGKDLSSNDYTNLEKSKLAAIAGVNTGDQDLSGLATISAVALKESISNKTTAVDMGGQSPSDILYPSQRAVKEFVLANAISGAVLDGGITNLKLAEAAVTFSKIQSIPSNTILGNTSSSTSIVQAIPTTGSDNVVLSNNPTIVSPNLVTPLLGDAIATTINNIALIDPGTQPASITVIGTTTIKGVNNGDNAPNQRYETILADGIVSVATDQPISGQKTFFNDLIMGNLGGIGTITPTTINFLNGSKIGDIDNLNNGNPDPLGSIDLYAPDGAKWVELNYANNNYFYLTSLNAFLEIGDNKWSYNPDGSTYFPNSIYNGPNSNKMEIAYRYDKDGMFINSGLNLVEEGANIELNAIDQINNHFADWNWDFNFNGSTVMPGSLVVGNGIDEPIISSSASNLKIQYNNFDYQPTYISGMNFNHSGMQLSIKDLEDEDEFIWNFKNGGNTIFPGNLSLGDKTTIDFNTFDAGLSITNSYLYSTGPYLKIKTRALTSQENSDDVANGISLEYDNISNITVNNTGVGLSVLNNSNQSSTFINLDESTFNFYANDNSNVQNRWLFNGVDASTHFPGNLLLSGNIETNGNLKMGNTVFPNVSGNPGDVLTIEAQTGNAIWSAPTTIALNSVNAPLNVSQGDEDEFGISIISPPKNLIHAYGSSIGFSSNVISGNTSSANKGSFQLDADGNMVFRTKQSGMFFDNFDGNGNGFISFRIGPESGPYLGMNLSKDGNLGVDGTVSAASNLLTSDIRIKKNIIPLSNSLPIIKKLNPVSYDKKPYLTSTDYSINENGFIAQELQKVLPSLVHESENAEKLLSVNYTAIIPILTKGIQEQQLEIEDLKNEIESIKKLLKTQKKRL